MVEGGSGLDADNDLNWVLFQCRSTLKGESTDLSPGYRPTGRGHFRRVSRRENHQAISGLILFPDAPRLCYMVPQHPISLVGEGE
jgi:hypothetical protein